MARNLGRELQPQATALEWKNADARHGRRTSPRRAATAPATSNAEHRSRVEDSAEAGGGAADLVAGAADVAAIGVAAVAAADAAATSSYSQGPTELQKVFRSNSRDFLRGDAAEFSEFASGFSDESGFVTFSAMGNRRQIGRVRLD